MMQTLAYSNQRPAKKRPGSKKRQISSVFHMLCQKIHSVPFGRMVGWSETLSNDANAAYSNQHPVSEDQAAKGDGWALSSICCAKDTFGL